MCDTQLLGQAMKLCQELDFGAVSLEGKSAANSLREFTKDQKRQWVLFLRVGHQVNLRGTGDILLLPLVLRIC